LPAIKDLISTPLMSAAAAEPKMQTDAKPAAIEYFIMRIESYKKVAAYKQGP